MIVSIVAGENLHKSIRDISRRLNVSGGMVSSASRALTVQVFGEELAPQEVVRRIVADVRKHGDEAVLQYVRKLDGAALPRIRLRVEASELVKAHQNVSRGFLQAVRRVIQRVRECQSHFMPKTAELLQPRDGVKLGLRQRPLRRVGIYVPGGRAVLPSSVIMMAVPAQVAGVAEIAMVTPCAPDGTVAPQMLATAHELGITEVYRVGGAQAIAALAYGTDTILQVDKIVGPGNIFVSLAKRQVYGHVDIDMIAGPSEILIVADETASPRFCAADMLSQAEHDPGASVLLTPSQELAQAASREVDRQVDLLSRAKAARHSISRYGLIGVGRDLDECIRLADVFAPEHLEIMTANPDEVLSRLSNYGTAFLGPYSPEPVGDYVAGPSHVLPTGGTARFFSGLSTFDFLKRSSVIEYTQKALERELPDILQLADAEGLSAHARSAEVRTEPEPET